MRVRACAVVQRQDCILTLVYNYPNGVVHALPGGTMDDGESLVDCLVREFQEELGITIQPGRLRLVGDMMPVGQLKQTVHLVFDAELISGEPTLNPAETSAAACAWLPMDSLAAVNLYPAVNQALLVDRAAGGADPRYVGNCLAREWA